MNNLKRFDIGNWKNQAVGSFVSPLFLPFSKLWNSVLFWLSLVCVITYACGICREYFLLKIAMMASVIIALTAAILTVFGILYFVVQIVINRNLECLKKKDKPIECSFLQDSLQLVYVLLYSFALYQDFPSLGLCLAIGSSLFVFFVWFVNISVKRKRAILAQS